MLILSNCQWVDCSAGDWSVANCLLDWSNGPLYEINLCQWASLLIHSFLLRGKSFISRQSVSTAVRRLCLNLSEHHLQSIYSGDPHKRKQENLILVCIYSAVPQKRNNPRESFIGKHWQRYKQRTHLNQQLKSL